MIDCEHTANVASGRTWLRRAMFGLGALALSAAGIQAVLASRASGVEPSPGQVAAGQERSAGEVADRVTLDLRQRVDIAVAALERGRLTITKELPGRVAFDDDRVTPVFSPVSGRVVEVHARKGMSVSTGEPLFVLDSPDMATAQADLVSARSDLAKALIGQDFARRAALRAARLFSVATIATKDVEQAQADLRRADDDVSRARMALKTVEGRLALLGKGEGEIAALARAEDHRVTIKAPIAGTIVDRKVGPGQLVAPGSSDPLVQIGDTRTVWVLADAFETDLESIHPGMECAISVPAHPGTTYPARVETLSPTVDPSTRTVRIRCVVANPRRELLPDMFATVALRAPTGAVLALPQSSVVTDGGRAMVWVEDSPGQYRRQVVHPGQTVEGRVIVEDGLRGGERIVVRGAILLTELAKGSY